jgi:hypothetical protein
MAPWYVRRKSSDDPYKSKHAGGRQPRRHARATRLRVRKNARTARARVNHWPRGRS